MTGKRIFNHDIMHCTHDAVVGNYLYSGRVLGMTEPDDLIQVHPDLQSQWTAITAHYHNIGLSHSQNPIWNVSFEQLRQHPDYEPSVFIFCSALYNSIQNDNWFRDRNLDSPFNAGSPRFLQKVLRGGNEERGRQGDGETGRDGVQHSPSLQVPKSPSPKNPVPKLPKTALSRNGLSRNQDWQDVVEFINSKNNFIRLAEELGVNVPRTLCAENQTQLKNHPDIPYPCYLKPAVSVDGVGIYRCANSEELDKALAKLDEHIPLQLQQEVTATKFLNLQYQAEAEKAVPLAATEQILDGFAHQGNRYPTADQPWELVQPIAQWMANKGMKGIFAFDVATVETETGRDYFAIECNPRFNGASYPTGIAQKLDINRWCSDNFTTKYHSLAEIELGDLEYTPNTGTGVIIVNWGSVLVGKLGVLLAGSIEQQEELRQLLKQILN